MEHTLKLRTSNTGSCQSPCLTAWIVRNSACIYSALCIYIYVLNCVITSAMEDTFSSLFVCLFVAQKLPNGFARNFQERFAMGRQTPDKILVWSGSGIRILDTDPYTDTSIYTCLGLNRGFGRRRESYHVVKFAMLTNILSFKFFGD